MEKTPDENAQMLERAKDEYTQMQKGFLKMMNDQEQKLKKAKAKMEKLRCQADGAQRPNLTILQASLCCTATLVGRLKTERYHCVMFLGLEVLKFVALFLMEEYVSHIPTVRFAMINLFFKMFV